MIDTIHIYKQYFQASSDCDMNHIESIMFPCIDVNEPFQYANLDNRRMEENTIIKIDTKMNSMKEIEEYMLQKPEGISVETVHAVCNAEVLLEMETFGIIYQTNKIYHLI